MTPKHEVAVLGSDGSPSPRLDITVTTKLTLSHQKVIVSGNLIEEYRYETPLLIGKGGRNTHKQRAFFNEIEPAPDRSEEYQRRSATRAKSTIRRKISANITQAMKFVTLTFANTNELDISDPQSTYLVYQTFMRKLKDKYGKLVYITVPELQKRGAVHYHLLIDLPYIKNDELAKIWGYGFVKIKKVTDIAKAPWYLAKYFSKENTFRLGNRRYYTSRGLSKSLTLYGVKAQKLIEKLHNLGVKPYPKGEYATEYNGLVQVYEYNLPQSPAQKETT